MVLAMWIVMSLLAGFVGRDREIGFVGFFFLALFLSPLLVFMILLLTMPRSRPAPDVIRRGSDPAN